MVKTNFSIEKDDNSAAALALPNFAGKLGREPKPAAEVEPAVACGPARTMIGCSASLRACAVFLLPAQLAAGLGSAAFGGFECQLAGKPASRRDRVVGRTVGPAAPSGKKGRSCPLVPAACKGG